MLDRESFRPNEDLAAYAEEFFGRSFTSQRKFSSTSESTEKILEQGERIVNVNGQTFRAIDLGAKNVTGAIRAKRGTGSGFNNKYGR